MFCVIEINLTKESWRIACTGLRGHEAKMIAEMRNNIMPIPSSSQIPGFNYRPDSRVYIMSHKKTIQENVDRFLRGY